MNKRYAEEANYWDTTVHPGNSQGEIIALLEEFGTDNVMFGQGNAGGRFAWLVLIGGGCYLAIMLVGHP